MTDLAAELAVHKSALNHLARRCHALELYAAQFRALKGELAGVSVPVTRDPRNEYMQAVIEEAIEAARKECSDGMLELR